MSVYKRKDSGVYHYDFQYRGIRFHGSTGETERGRAQRVERQERERAKTAYAAQKRIDQGILTIDEAAGRYWHEIGQHSNEKDLEANIGRLLADIGPTTLLTDISDNRVAGLVAKRRAQTRRGKAGAPRISNGQVNRSFTQILRRIMLRARTVWKVDLPDMPDWPAHLLPESPGTPREISIEEEAKLVAHERDEYRAVRLFSQMTGLRLREVVTLTWANVDFSGGFIRVTGKGDKPHRIPITPSLEALLRAEQGKHETAVFTYVAQRSRTCAKSGKTFVKGQRYPVTYWGVTSRRRRDWAKAGVDAKWHDLRDTAAMRMLRGSNNLKAVQRLLNHSDVRTTAVYADALFDDVRDAMLESETKFENRRSESRQKSRADDDDTS